jgi:hypothetical protein
VVVCNQSSMNFVVKQLSGHHVVFDVHGDSALGFTAMNLLFGLHLCSSLHGNFADVNAYIML